MEVHFRGFKEEGRIRKGVWIEGAWEDIILMGILEEEWVSDNQHLRADATS